MADDDLPLSPGAQPSFEASEQAQAFDRVFDQLTTSLLASLNASWDAMEKRCVERWRWDAMDKRASAREARLAEHRHPHQHAIERKLCADELEELRTQNAIDRGRGAAARLAQAQHISRPPSLWAPENYSVVGARRRRVGYAG